MKIRIRKQRLSDAEKLKDLLNDNEVLKYLTGIPFPYTLAKSKKDIKQSQKEWKTGKSYHFTILADNEIVGNIILHNPNKDKGRYDLGFFIGRKFWGKGIVTEAIKQTIKFGFNKLNLYRIQGDNDSDNPASGKVMKKAGMKLEGIQKKIQKKGNKFIDLYLWGITK